MMSEKLNKLFEKLEKIRGSEEFFDELKIYFSENFNKLNFDIIKVVPFPPYYLKLKDIEIDKSVQLMLSETTNVKYINRLLVVNDYYVFTLNETLTSKYSLLFKNLMDQDLDEIEGLCGYIDSFYNSWARNR